MASATLDTLSKTVMITIDPMPQETQPIERCILAQVICKAIANSKVLNKPPNNSHYDEPMSGKVGHPDAG